MVTLRYGKEYRLDLETLPDGKQKRKLCYIGPLYDYEAAEDVHGKQRVILLILSILSVIVFISGLSFYSNLSRIWYISIPYAVNALLCFFLLESLFFFWKYRTDLEREKKQRGGDRFKGVYLISGITYLISCIGIIAVLIGKVISPECADYIFFFIAIQGVVLSVVGFTYAGKIKYVEKHNPEADKWADK